MCAGGNRGAPGSPERCLSPAAAPGGGAVRDVPGGALGNWLGGTAAGLRVVGHGRNQGLPLELKGQSVSSDSGLFVV